MQTLLDKLLAGCTHSDEWLTNRWLVKGVKYTDVVNKACHSSA